MRKLGILLVISLFAISACAEDSANTTEGSTVLASKSPEESPPTLDGEPGSEPSEPTIELATNCLPGTWVARMPELVATLPIEGGAKYLSGSYNFTVRDDNTYTAEYSDVTFRIGTKKEFVDVYNSWTEAGMWIGGLTADDWNSTLQKLNLDTSRLKLSDLEMSDGLLSTYQVDDPSSMVLIAGDDFEMIDAYGMVQGAVRTPPLSDEGAALIAIGTVDCESGVLQVDNLLPSGPSILTLDRVN